jgi:hypothetical protein
MLKVDPEANSGQTLLPIFHSFLAFVLWSLDIWKKSVPIATPCTGSMKGKRHLRWEILTGNHTASGDQSSCNSCLTHLSTWRTCLQVQTPKAVTLRTTFVSTALPLRLRLWDATLSRLRSVMPTVAEVDLTHFRSTAPFVTVKSLYFQLRATCLRMLSYTSMILHMLLRDYQKGMKIWTMRL